MLTDEEVVHGGAQDWQNVKTLDGEEVYVNGEGDATQLTLLNLLMTLPSLQGKSAQEIMEMDGLDLPLAERRYLREKLGDMEGLETPEDTDIEGNDHSMTGDLPKVDYYDAIMQNSDEPEHFDGAQGSLAGPPSVDDIKPSLSQDTLAEGSEEGEIRSTTKPATRHAEPRSSSAATAHNDLATDTSFDDFMDVEGPINSTTSHDHGTAWPLSTKDLPRGKRQASEVASPPKTPMNQPRRSVHRQRPHPPDRDEFVDSNKPNKQQGRYRAGGPLPDQLHQWNSVRLMTSEPEEGDFDEIDEIPRRDPAFVKALLGHSPGKGHMRIVSSAAEGGPVGPIKTNGQHNLASLEKPNLPPKLPLLSPVDLTSTSPHRASEHSSLSSTIAPPIVAHRSRNSAPTEISNSRLEKARAITRMVFDISALREERAELEKRVRDIESVATTAELSSLKLQIDGQNARLRRRHEELAPVLFNDWFYANHELTSLKKDNAKILEELKWLRRKTDRVELMHQEIATLRDNTVPKSEFVELKAQLDELRRKVDSSAANATPWQTSGLGRYGDGGGRGGGRGGYGRGGGRGGWGGRDDGGFRQPDHRGRSPPRTYNTNSSNIWLQPVVGNLDSAMTTAAADGTTGADGPSTTNMSGPEGLAFGAGAADGGGWGNTAPTASLPAAGGADTSTTSEGAGGWGNSVPW